jgi:peptidoglycan/LPS O-acetylase OafA/YrhL
VTASQQHRFVALDGLRGVAAFAVAVLHIGEMTRPQNPTVFPAGLAVDFFFMLSGFVLAFAYFERLEHGLSWSGFMRARLVRLYPLIPIGVLFGAFVSLAKQHVQGVPVPGEGLGDIPTTLLLLPAGLLQSRPTPNFTFDPPIWSLFFEFLASALFATRLRRMRGSVLLAFMIVFTLLDGIVTAVRVTGPYIENGGLLSLLMNIPRTAFAFTFGVVVFRSGVWAKVPAVPIAVTALVLGVLLLIPGENGSAYGVAVLFLMFPLILIVGAACNPAGGMKRICQFAGDLSYPLYILHYPVARAFVYALKSHVADPDLLTAAALLAAIAISWAVLKLYDEPMRRRLQRWRPRHSASVKVVTSQQP